MVVSEEQFCPAGDIWHYLETVLVVIAWDCGATWRLVGRSSHVVKYPTMRGTVSYGTEFFSPQNNAEAKTTCLSPEALGCFHLFFQQWALTEAAVHPVRSVHRESGVLLLGTSQSRRETGQSRAKSEESVLVKLSMIPFGSTGEGERK